MPPAARDPIAARLASHRLDPALAAGVPAETSPALALQARLLLTDATRPLYNPRCEGTLGTQARIAAENLELRTRAVARNSRFSFARAAQRATGACARRS